MLMPLFLFAGTGIIIPFTLGEPSPSSYSLETFNDNEVMKFHPYGNIKTITKKITVTNYYNLDDFMKKQDEEYESLNEKVDEVCPQISTPTPKECKTMKISDTLKTFDNLLETTRNTVLDIKEHQRKKQKRDISNFLDFFGGGGLSAQQENQIRTNFKNTQELFQNFSVIVQYLIDQTNNNFEFMDASKNFSKDVAESSASMIVSMKLVTIFNAIKDFIGGLDKKVAAIFRVMVDKKMSSDLISVEQFRKDLDDKVKEKLEDDEEYSFHSVREFYNQLPVEYTVDDKGITFTMEIPIIKKSVENDKLYRIEKLPINLKNDTLPDQYALINTPWKYVANHSGLYSFYATLEFCYKTTSHHPTYFCELQGPKISSKLSKTDCMTKLFADRQFDPDICKNELTVKYYPKQYFTKSDISPNKYFYHIPNKDSLELSIDLDGISKKIILNSIGQIELKARAIAVATKNGIPITLTSISIDQTEIEDRTDDIVVKVSKNSIDGIMKITGPASKELEDLVDKIMETRKDVKTIDVMEFPWEEASMFSGGVIILIVIMIFISIKLMMIRKNMIEQRKAKSVSYVVPK